MVDIWYLNSPQMVATTKISLENIYKRKYQSILMLAKGRGKGIINSMEK